MAPQRRRGWRPKAKAKEEEAKAKAKAKEERSRQQRVRVRLPLHRGLPRHQANRLCFLLWFHPWCLAHNPRGLHRLFLQFHFNQRTFCNVCQPTSVVTIKYILSLTCCKLAFTLSFSIGGLQLPNSNQLNRLREPKLPNRRLNQLREPKLPNRRP